MSQFRHVFLMVSVLTLGLAASAAAQRFGSSTPSAAQPTVAAKPQTAAAPKLQQPAAPKLQQPAANQLKTVPDTPGVYQIRQIGGETVINDSPKILLYMRDYNVYRDLSGQPACNMRFYVFSSFPNKITNISYRLKWPNVETPLSFEDVQPNRATFFNYALLGNGCYDLDKAPNVIVNRCRIRNTTQQDCAEAIRWIN